MSMSTNVIGFKPVDELWNKMKKIYDSCKDANIDLPKEVNKYFGYEEPDDNGIEVDISEASFEWNDENCREGIEIDINKLPKDIHIIRFYNSW